MVNKTDIGILLILVMFISSGCQKQEKGFLSSNLYYIENPFTIQQGITTTSSPLVADGSSLPLITHLLAVKNKATGENADSLFLKPQTISIYTGTITYLDTTEAMLRAKLKDSTVAPFSINEKGGRLQFTQSSKYIEPGTYNIDISVSNVRGTRVLQNACEINITPISTIDTILYKAWTTSDLNGVFYSVDGPLNVSIKYDAAGPDKIVFKLLDKNGTPFNAANGEIVPRSGRPSFKNWNPYYPPQPTDTSLEFKYPSGIPMVPAYLNTVIADGSSWNDGIVYYQVPARFTDINQNVNVVLTSQYFVTKGTYIVTFYLNNVVRKQ